MKGNGKYYIALHGEVHEVSREVYQAYYQGKRKEKYIYEQDQAHGQNLDSLLQKPFHAGTSQIILRIISNHGDDSTIRRLSASPISTVEAVCFNIKVKMFHFPTPFWQTNQAIPFTLPSLTVSYIFSRRAFRLSIVS